MPSNAFIVIQQGGNTNTSLLSQGTTQLGGFPWAGNSDQTTLGETYFYLGDIPPFSPFAASLSFNFPTNSSTVSDFNNWIINWSHLDYGSVSVYYGTSSSSLNYVDSTSFSPILSSNPLPIRKSQPLWYPPLSIPATWYAEAIWQGTSTEIFTPIIQFFVNPTSTNGETSSTLLTPTTNCQFTSSSFFADPVGNIQQGICQALVFLFIPNTSQQQDIQGRASSTYQIVSTKPPFGYVALLNGFLTSINDASTSVLHVAFIGAFMNPVDLALAGVVLILIGVALYHLIAKFKP